ncbi:hypothetical protein J4Q44_G00035800 [Coregonus suidteri]|uniref:Uncharacterized protein n=1 Tax=Coregonus suidteri TaxID=861788 RepID=A0AAN8R9L8_9TELE
MCFLPSQVLLLDGNLLGHLAAIVAKQVLLGHKVVDVRISTSLETSTLTNVLLLDGNLLGHLAAIVAKQVLLGHKVVDVRISTSLETSTLTNDNDEMAQWSASFEFLRHVWREKSNAMKFWRFVM